MQNAAFDTTFESRLAKLNLAPVMAHVKQHNTLDAATLANAEELYREFLRLIHIKGVDSKLRPPHIVDIVWDSHLMFTQKYMADCEMLFGRIIHHLPLIGAEAEHEQMESTLPHFQNLPTFRALKADMVELAQCGGW